MNESNNVAPCMGGFCTRRTGCAHYVQPANRRTCEPSEFLCRERDNFVPLGQVPARQGVPA